MELTQEEMARYARHLSLPEVGLEGQRRLKRASVLCLGAGGLGSPVLLYLAAAGVGRLGVVDDDRVELSNLQRQIVHGSGSCGRLKVESARERVGEINPEVRVEVHPVRFTAATGEELVRGYDVVVDGSDNFATRYAASDVCVRAGLPYVYGSVLRFEGQVAVFDPARGGPCYRCIHPRPPAAGTVPSCAEGGVLGVVPGIIGTLQALAALKLLLGLAEAATPRLLHFDGLASKFREFRLRRDPCCPRCRDVEARQAPVQQEEENCEMKTNPSESDLPTITVRELARRRSEGAPHTLLDVREPHELEIAALPGCLHIPLGQLESRWQEVPANGPVYVLCRSGVRSGAATRWLQARGWADVHNIEGGILAWAEAIDPTMARY